MSLPSYGPVCFCCALPQALTWPTEAVAIAPFAVRVLDFIQTAAEIAASDSYVVKNHARKIIGLAEVVLGPECWDGYRMHEIAEWVPDKHKTMASLATWLGRDVRLRFAISPCWMSGFFNVFVHHYQTQH